MLPKSSAASCPAWVLAQHLPLSQEAWVMQILRKESLFVGGWACHRQVESGVLAAIRGETSVRPFDEEAPLGRGLRYADRTQRQYLAADPGNGVAGGCSCVREVPVPGTRGVEDESLVDRHLKVVDMDVLTRRVNSAMVLSQAEATGRELTELEYRGV
jgi:hypothetical protein